MWRQSLSVVARCFLQNVQIQGGERGHHFDMHLVEHTQTHQLPSAVPGDPVPSRVPNEWTPSSRRTPFLPWALRWPAPTPKFFPFGFDGLGNSCYHANGLCDGEREQSAI